MRVEHLVWSVEGMRSGLSMGQLDTLKAVLLDQVSKVDEAKVSAVPILSVARAARNPVANIYIET